MKHNLPVVGLVALSIALVPSCHPTTTTASDADNFGGFPVGATLMFSVEGFNSILRGLSLRERREQMRDWLLYSLVSSSGQSPRQISHVLSEVLPVRTDYLRSLQSFRTGPIRSADLGRGEAVVLLPVEPGPIRIADLARVADDHRKNAGKPLALIQVFEYQFGGTGGSP